MKKLFRPTQVNINFIRCHDTVRKIIIKKNRKTDYPMIDCREKVARKCLENLVKISIEILYSRGKAFNLFNDILKITLHFIRPDIDYCSSLMSMDSAISSKTIKLLINNIFTTIFYIENSGFQKHTKLNLD